jgi:hypothetical protein
MALGLLGVLTPEILAEPMHIGFRKMVDGCEVIAVARFAGEGKPDWNDHSAELELTRVIKGQVKPGKYRVCFQDYPKIGNGTGGFVAFFGKGLCWRFVAHPISRENRVTDGILRVEGFYDSNAYSVSPGLMTLEQIETFLKERTLAYTIRGPLYFPQRGQPDWEASPIALEVRYDAMTGHASVVGLPELKGFPARPSVYVGDWDNDIVVTYSRGSDAPLAIHGRVRSADRSGVMRAKFFVAKPDVLTRQEFVGYLSDPSKGHSYYTVRIACAPCGGETKPRVVTLIWNKELGCMGALEGWSEDQLRLSSFGSTVDRDAWLNCQAIVTLASGEELVLRFECGKVRAGTDVFPRTFEANLLYRLWEGEVPGKVLLRDGNGEWEVTSFTASLGQVRYAKLDPPRTEGQWLKEDAAETRPEDDEGYEAFDCGTGMEVTTVSAGNQPRLLRWAAVAVALLLAAVFGWRAWRRREAKPRPG